MRQSIARIRHPRVARKRHADDVTFAFPVRPHDVLNTTAETDWRPLHRALEREPEGTASISPSAFRFIGHAAGPDDIGTLHVYRHRNTRRYLVLDARGHAYRYEPRTRCYGRVELRMAVERVIAG